MQKRLSLFMALTYALVCLIIGCGGGGGGSNAVTVSGVAATGAPIKNGTVTLKDSAGAAAKTATTGNDGFYSIDVTGLTAPFFIKIDYTPAGGVPTSLYSVGTAAGKININPLTNLVLANAAGVSDPASVFDAITLAVINAVKANLNSAVSNIEALIQPIATSLGVTTVNMITGEFRADGTGLDMILDKIAVNLNTGTGAVGVTMGGAPVVTIPNISVMTQANMPLITIPTTVIITPRAVSVPVNGTAQFTAYVSNTNKSVTWSVTGSGNGSINSSGFYTAPATAGTYYVTAKSAADTTKYDTAAIIVTEASTQVSSSVLVGSWKLVSQSYWGDGSMSMRPVQPSLSGKIETITFNSNGTGTLVSYDMETSSSITYWVTHDTGRWVDAFNWSVSNNTLHLTDGLNSQSVPISISGDKILITVGPEDLYQYQKI